MTKWDMPSYRQIIIPPTIPEMVESRDRAVMLYETAHRTLNDAVSEMSKHLLHGGYSVTKEMDAPKTVTNRIDANYWRKAFDAAGFFLVMDQQAINEFQKSLEGKDVPVFSVDNCRSTFVSYMADMDNIFKRGVVNVLKNLSNTYWHNKREPFKIASKVIVEYWVDNFSEPCLRYEKRAVMNDIDRVMKVLDGKDHGPRQLEGLVNAAWKDGFIYEDDYYIIKGHKNGNVHFTFKRQDLLDEANQLIHEWYEGNALAEAA